MNHSKRSRLFGVLVLSLAAFPACSPKQQVTSAVEPTLSPAAETAPAHSKKASPAIARTAQSNVAPRVEIEEQILAEGVADAESPVALDRAAAGVPSIPAPQASETVASASPPRAGRNYWGKGASPSEYRELGRAFRN